MAYASATGGDRAAIDQLYRILYPELRALAHLAYQWLRNAVVLSDGAGIAGATGNALTLTAPFTFDYSRLSSQKGQLTACEASVGINQGFTRCSRNPPYGR